MAKTDLSSFPEGGDAVVLGATGGIGAALVSALEESGACRHVVGLSRSSDPAIDLTDEASLAAAAMALAKDGVEPRLIFDATGFLHDDDFMPERSWTDLDPGRLARDFAINAFGPALAMKHFLPLLPREDKAVFATLSARVGSIADNGYGGWYSYRASKAALNQFVKTASIELKRKWKAAACVALHPGTVDTGLSAPFAKSGLKVRPAEEAAVDLLAVIDMLSAEDTGGFFDYQGERVPW